MICRKCSQSVPDGPFCCQCGTKQEVPQRSPRRRGNGTGTAFRRGKTWTAQVTKYTYVDEDETGLQHRVRRYQTKGGFPTKKAALDYIDTLKGGQARKVPTLLELYQLWEKNDLPKLSPDRQTAYKKARQRLEPVIGRKIDTLTTSDLQDCVSSMAKSHYTARDMKTLLSHLYRRALADQFVTVNLSQFIVLPELEEKEAEPFTAQEVDAMWSAFADGNIFVGYLLLMIYSGMMPGELFACRKDMINLDRCEIYGCGKKTKFRKSSTIVFAECVRPVVEELMQSVPGDLLQPKHETQWYDRYHETVKTIGVRDLPPYSCRHTTGTEAARQNLNAPVIQKILRHAKITTSQRYIHIGSDEAHTGINTFSAKQKAPEAQAASQG